MQTNQRQKYLMLFSIGPVQEFIAQARITRDLWFGSYLLSELSREGAETFKKLCGDLVYPVLGKNGQEESAQTSAPNKILGVIVTDNPKEIAWQVRRAVTAKWKQYAEEVRKKVDPYINIGTWNRQVNDFVEFYASWIDMDQTEQSGQFDKAGMSVYRYSLDKVETLLAARKLLRDFKQNNPGVMYGEKKSSLDGGRESVWHAHEKHRSQMARLGMKEDESLDAISVIKRLSLKVLQGKKNFPSVCETAFLPYKKMIEQDAALQGAVGEYLRQVKVLLNRSCNQPGYEEARLFYPRRIEEYLEEVVPDNAPDTSEQIKKWQLCIAEHLENLYQGKYSEGRLKGHSLPRPTPYYAFLVADGDHMGRQLRSIVDMEGHIAFSKSLSKFSIAAADVMKEHDGQLIYSGGDDVMAYLPVHRCLDAARELRRCFVKSMKDSPENAENPPTLSVGIVIAHMLEPLEEVRQMAQEAEKIAKQTRNTLTVHFQKQSGNDSMKAAFSFERAPVRQMQKIRRWMDKPYFSVKFAYELRELYRTYMRIEPGWEWMHNTENLGKLIWMEIERLALKKKPDGISAEDIKKWLEDDLKSLYRPGDEPLEELQRLAEQFIVTIQLKEAEGHYEKMAENTTA